MDVTILHTEIQQFINTAIGNSVSKLALQKNPFPEVKWSTILNQIEAKTKAKNKLPTWFNSPKIIYPSKIAIEQTSSEKTALYKSSLVTGKRLIDLTGGFGVDAFYFSKRLEQVSYCEMNSDLSKIAEHNFKQLKAPITCYTGDSLAILQSLQQKWDWIYIDPSRRNETKGKVFLLADCLPNIIENLDFYFEKANAILVKTAPILDISAGLSELKNVKAIHIVALENEVKELLWELHQNYNGLITVKTVNITGTKNSTFNFTLNQNPPTANYSLPQKYIYEPNSAIMKSGGFNEIRQLYNINKLHKHSHLYTAEKLIDFPGRIFEVQRAILYSKKEMETHLKNSKCNVSTRNFPETVEQIRKKWQLKDGGAIYCFFTTDKVNNRIVLICNKGHSE